MSLFAMIMTILFCAAGVAFPVGVILLFATKDLEYAWQATWVTFLGLLVIGLAMWGAFAAIVWAWSIA